MKPLFWIVLTICVSATAAERVASLSPNLTETVVRLGAEDQLVGRSSACDYPESVRKLPVVGRFGVPALEPLLATRPTLVIAETLRNDADAERLRELGVRLEAFPAVTLDDYFRNLARLGPRTFDGIAQLREILRPPASVRHTQPQSRAE